jgi:purine-nucleoside phosphorylase
MMISKNALSYPEMVAQATAYLQAIQADFPDKAIILGTGLGNLVSMIDVEVEVPFSEIPNFPVSTVESHEGLLVFGSIKGTPIVALHGRVHLYEGYDANQVTLPVRVLGECGIKTLIVSNASGAMNPEYRSGDIMIIEDHINLTGRNPLEGPNHDAWGPRFPDMSDPYASELRKIARVAANDCSIPLHEGIYVACVGPNLETRAEYTMLRLMGADVVGMSTVPEVLVARHMDINVIAFSVVTDECFPETLQPLSLEDVLAAAAKASPALSTLLIHILPQL